jgi:hypothetical protein
MTDLCTDVCARQRARTVGPTWHPDARTLGDRERAGAAVEPEHTERCAPYHPRARLCRRVVR